MKLNKVIAIAIIVLAFVGCGNKVESENTAPKTETVNGETMSTFKVWGNCEMCKETIESSLKAF